MRLAKAKGKQGKSPIEKKKNKTHFQAQKERKKERKKDFRPTHFETIKDSISITLISSTGSGKISKYFVRDFP